MTIKGEIDEIERELYLEARKEGGAQFMWALLRHIRNGEHFHDQCCECIPYEESTEAAQK